MSRSPWLLATTWFVLCLSTLAAGLAVRLGPVEQSFAWPTTGILPAAAALAGPVALALAVVAVLMLLALTGAAREGNRARPFAELILFFPLLFAFVWFVLPAGPPAAREWIIGGILAAAAWWLARHCPGPIPGPVWTGRRSSLLTDALLILLPVALGLALGHTPDFKASGFSFFLYPLYAFIQLLVFLLIPVTRLRALGVSRADSTLFAALVFSLVHWPNPLVMLVTMAGMLIWAHQFQKGRPMWQLALVMGLTATTFTQFLPDDLTRHVRVGPGYVRSEAVLYLAVQAGENGRCDPASYLREIYPETVGRPIQDQELECWLALLKKARRSTWANIFLVSSEYRKLRSEEGLTLCPPEEIHWTAWPAEWKNMVLDFASEEYWSRCGSNLEGFIPALYRDILGREASPQELADWTTDLTIGQRKRLAEVLLDWRQRNGEMSFAGMSVEDLRLTN